MGQDVETQTDTPTRIPHFRQVFDKAGIAPEVRAWRYNGSGTEEDPYAVTWIEQDPRNPMLYSSVKRWCFIILIALAALTVSIDSSAYSGAAAQIMDELDCSEEVFILGISLFVLGFAIGPILWGPFSEMFGRRVIWIGTYTCFMAFNAGAAGAQSIETLLILRFFAGAVGSNQLITAGAIVADQFSGRQRGLVLAYYAVTPFFGPTIGPILGGFVAESIGWRWILAIMAISSCILLVIYFFTVPETFAPVILQHRAKALSASTGDVYKSQLVIKQGEKTLGQVLKISLSRPWILLVREPIVTVLAIYQALIYATLYLSFAAFPIVYQEKRGWSPGIGGLAFLGIAVGMIFTIPYNIWTNKRYGKLLDRQNGSATPEARLPLCMAGAIAAPISMFWFAWTNYPSIHWIVSIAAGAPFGFALVVIFQGINNYLVDSYTIFAASVLAGTAVLRSVMASAFPLFTGKMYHDLGIHWATMVPACLFLLFAPFPFLLYKYGSKIRARCKYAAEAQEYAKQVQGQAREAKPSTEDVKEHSIVAAEQHREPQNADEANVTTSIDGDNKSDKEVM